MPFDPPASDSGWAALSGSGPPPQPQSPAPVQAATAPTPSIVIEDERTSLQPEGIRRAFLDQLQYGIGKSDRYATPFDRYQALALVVRDRLMARWIKTQETYRIKDVKRVYYLSAEFLLGRALGNNLHNLGLYQTAEQVMRELGYHLGDLLEKERDAGLGNGGLGRLAACFMESMATLGCPAYGYGIKGFMLSMI